MKVKYVSVKNLAKYQRYQDRQLPWIKLYYKILDDQAFMTLNEINQSRFMKLLLISTRCNNRISCDQLYLQNMLRVRGDIDLTPLIHAGLLVTFRPQKHHITHTSVPQNMLSDQSRVDKNRSEKSVGIVQPVDKSEGRLAHRTADGLEPIGPLKAFFESKAKDTEC